MDKENVIYIQWNAVQLKEEENHIASNKIDDLENITLSKISQMQISREYTHIYMESERSQS